MGPNPRQYDFRETMTTAGTYERMLQGVIYSQEMKVAMSVAQFEIGVKGVGTV